MIGQVWEPAGSVMVRSFALSLTSPTLLRMASMGLASQFSAKSLRREGSDLLREDSSQDDETASLSPKRGGAMGGGGPPQPPWMLDIGEEDEEAIVSFHGDEFQERYLLMLLVSPPFTLSYFHISRLSLRRAATMTRTMTCRPTSGWRSLSRPARPS